MYRNTSLHVTSYIMSELSHFEAYAAFAILNSDSEIAEFFLKKKIPRNFFRLLFPAQPPQGSFSGRETALGSLV
jgi:hypothetical protein